MLLTKLFYRSTVFFEAMRQKSSQPQTPARRDVREIPIESETLNRIEEFATYFGIPIEEAINKAVTEWMYTTGDMMMAYTEHERRTTAARPKLTLVKRPS